MPKEERDLLEQSTSTFVLGEMLKQKLHSQTLYLQGISILAMKMLINWMMGIKSIASTNQLPFEVLNKNSSVDPRLQNNLYNYFVSKIYVSLLPRYPAQIDFYDSLKSIFTTIEQKYF